jgi:hypothetical protein
VSKRLIFCEGPDDLNALRAVALHQRWAKPDPASSGPPLGAGQERVITLQAGIDLRIEIKVPSKPRGAPGEGKSALPLAVADELRLVRPQVDPADESYVSLVAAVFDPDEKTAADFHNELTHAIGERAPAWTITAGSTPGVWQVQREAGEQVEVRAVDWRAPGGVLDGLPEHKNLERLLCAVLAKAYPGDVPAVERWLTEIGAARTTAGRKPPTWKAAIHVWLAAVYEKADDLNAASRFLHQQDECKPHIHGILNQVGLLADLRPLLGPP